MNEEARVPDWLRAHYQRVDANDFAPVLAAFSADVEVRFGTRPRVRGRQAAARLLAAVHRAFESSRHRFANVWQIGATTLVEFDVSYVLHDGSAVKMRTFTVLDREGELIRSLRVYIDEGPLLGAAPARSGRPRRERWRST